MPASKHSKAVQSLAEPPSKRQKLSPDLQTPSSEVEGISFKFKARINGEGFNWLQDVIVIAFPTPSGAKDELVVDIKTKRKDLGDASGASSLAERTRSDGATDEDLREDDDDEEDEDDNAMRDFEEMDGYEESEDDMSGSIGSVFGRLINRAAIRRNFWRDMEEPSQDTAALAFNIFDRYVAKDLHVLLPLTSYSYGCLRPEFINGSREGSGIFGAELNTGCMLQLEMIRVQEDYRRRGVASAMIKIILDQAFKLERALRVALVWPAFLNRDIPESLPKADRQKLSDDYETRSIGLCRKAGFRRVGDSVWFARMFDDEHPSHALPADKDFNPPDPPVKLTDIEQLERDLERKRTKAQHLMMTLVVSDRFKGHSEVEVQKLLTLRGNTSPSQIEKARAKYGCTCGSCIAGYLSPRMRVLKIVCEYENDNEMNDEDYVWKEAEDYGDQGLCGIASWQYLPSSIKPFMKSNKSYRVGHRLLHGHIITCLDKGIAPTPQNILKVLEDASEWPPNTKNFIQKAGIAGIEAILRSVCDVMADKDLKAGGGIDEIAEYEEAKATEEKHRAEGRDPAEAMGMDKMAWVFRNMRYEDGAYEWDAMLKEKDCRNDSEFGFLLGMLIDKTIGASMEEYWE